MEPAAGRYFFKVVEDISLHILDIAENSVSAGATQITINLSEDNTHDVFTLIVEDDGGGVPDEIGAKVLDPFTTTRLTRKIGLGLPLLAQSARDTGGELTVESAKGSGTVVTATFRLTHIDMKPLGNVAETLVVLIAGNPHIDFLFTYAKKNNAFSFDTRMIKGELEGLPINSPPVLEFLRKYFTESIREL
jgi:anti-sigma regulatory factor (Ser/Thr protein kinase)